MEKQDKIETIEINGVKYARADQAIVADYNAPERDQSDKPHPYKIGECYCVRTVTMIQTGRLVEVFDQELVLDEAAWIADTGRFNKFLKGQTVNEVEPFLGQVVVNRGAIIDVCQIQTLHKEVK